MTPQQLRDKAKADEWRGLCNPLSIEIFETWYVLGGSQSPPTLTDLWQLPAWLLQDIRYISSELGEARDKARTSRKNKAALTPKPRGKH